MLRNNIKHAISLNSNILRFQKKGFKINTPEVYFNNFDESLSKTSIDSTKLNPMIEAGNLI
jgi:hypothetical protein